MYAWQDREDDAFNGRVLWKGLGTKVVCVRWHVVEESVVAFALDDGRCGLYHTHSDKFRVLPGTLYYVICDM